MKRVAFITLFTGLFTLLMGQHQSDRANADTALHVPTDTFRMIENHAFQVGEYLRYRVHYGIVNAGIAELSVKNKIHKNGRETFRIVGTGKSVGLFNMFFKVRDRYETYMDAQSLMPWEFVRDVDEGGYEIQRHIFFDQHQHQARDIKKNKDKIYEVPGYSQDILSAFYYARCAPTPNLQPGHMIAVNTFLDHEVFPMKLKFMGYETIKTKFGKINCMKYMPVVQKGRVFKEEEGMTIWVSNDSSRIPIRLKTDLLIGSIKMDLQEYKGLKKPLQFKD